MIIHSLTFLKITPTFSSLKKWLMKVEASIVLWQICFMILKEIEFWTTFTYYRLPYLKIVLEILKNCINEYYLQLNSAPFLIKLYTKYKSRVIRTILGYVACSNWGPKISAVEALNRCHVTAASLNPRDSVVNKWSFCAFSFAQKTLELTFIV